MIGETNIRRAAKLMMQHYGAEAELASTQRAENFFGLGKIEGFEIWMRIKAAIHDLAREETGSGNLLN